MRLAFYCGKSAISRLIQFRTWGQYSHVAHLLSDGGVIEAWYGGVRRCESVSEQHSRGTKVDIFKIKNLSADDDLRVMRQAFDRIGQPYDYRGLLGFLLRVHLDSEEQVFCSEMIMEDYQNAGINLLANVRSDKVSPTMLSYSPLLVFEKQIITR